MYLLDTVAISETSKQNLHPGMLAFLDEVPDHDLHISVVTTGELRFGWSRLPEGKRRNSIHNWAKDVESSFSGRILSIDVEISQIWGTLRALVHRSGYTIDLQDLLIAATAIRHDLTVVTRNVKDFAPTGCQILNPWESQQ